MEQMSNSMRALQLALGHSRWRCGPDPKDSRILQARAPGRGYHNSLKFAFEDDQIDLDDSVVRVVNDAREYRPGQFFQLEDLHPGDAVDGSMRIRLGQDILFPFLRENSESNGPLQDYSKYVRDIYLGSLLSEGNQSNPTEEPVADRLSRLKLLKGEQRPYADVALDAIASESRRGQSALIAFDALLDRNDFFYRELFEPHITQLTKLDDRKLSRIPLFLSATDVRVLGLERAFWEAGRQATGLALSSELMSLLIELGYFHLYMPDIGSLRTDYDLDPNTEHIGDIFAAVGQGGSFTMGCERELVFQGPVFGDPGAEEPNKTLGDRFYYADRLTLYDTGSIPPDRMHAELAAWSEFAAIQMERITRISENCLSPNEVREVLIRLGAIDNLVAGAGFSETDLERALRSILRGERLRPGNVRSALAAVTNSGLFRSLAGGQLTIRSKVFASWLVSDGVFKALEAQCYQADSMPLDHALEIANLPASTLQWALARGNEKFVEDVKEAIRPYLSRHRFRDGSDPSKATLIENLWTLLLAIAADIHSRGGALKGTDVIGDLCGQDVKFKSLALPQACFASLDLTGWLFEDCRLRNATFLDCKLQGATMKDCLLSGASFERCDFGARTKSLNLKSFSGSDVSGAEFKKCRFLSELFQVEGDAAKKLLERSNWTASSVVFDVREGDKEATSRLEAATRVVNEHSATSAGFKTVQMLQDGKISDLETSWPASAARSFAHAQWRDRPVTVKTPDFPNGLLVTKDGFVEVLENSFNPSERTFTPKEKVWKAVSCIAERLDDQVFLAVENEGQVWHARVEDNCCTWRTLRDIPLVRDVVITDRGNGELIAALTHAEVAGALTIATLDNSGTVLSSCEVNMRFSEDIGAMSWIEAQRAGKSYPELLVGPQSGGAFVVHQNGSHWQVAPFQDDLSFITINSFGYSPRENIAIACAQGGRVLGYRNIEAGRIEPLFSFHTAHEWFADVAMLNHQGQMLVAGLTVDEIKEKSPLERKVLWALVQPFGNVVTIVSRLPVKGQIEPPIALKTDSDSGKVALNDAPDLRIKQVRRSLKSLIQASHSIEVSPILRKPVVFLLSIPQPYDGNYELPESIDDYVGNRFRTISLVIRGKVPNDPSQEFERHYTEAEMDEIYFGPSQLRIRCSLEFHRKVQMETARLTVCYPSTDPEREIKESWEFLLQIEWEDNPFASNGNPVSGDQFFGLDNEIKSVLEGIQFGNNVIVRSCRRAGKSSFVQRVAELLRAGEKSHVAVVIAGNDVATDGNIFPPMQDYLRKIGNLEGKVDYLELAGLSLPSDDTYGAFKLLAETAIRRGHEPPFTVFVDEWGYLKEKIGPDLANMADELSKAGVALCLTSTPGDFRTADSASLSNDYRFFSHKLDIGRLQEDALRSLITQPLERRNIPFDDDVVQAVLRFSSGAPMDANILMHYALLAAKQESTSNHHGNGSASGLRIQLHHLLPRKGDPETEALKNLEQKYMDFQEFLIAKLEPGDREEVLALAGEDFCPTVEEPNPPPTALWDIQPFGIPLKGMEGDKWRSVFAEAGYRVALVEGEKTDNGITPGPSAYKLWIPWGMAKYFRRLRRTMGGL